MAYSRFNYLGTSGLAALIPTMSGVTDHDLAATFITDAERMIDAYVGSMPRFYPDLTGTFDVELPSGSLTISGSSFGNRRPDYWAKGGNYLIITDVPGSPTSALIGTKRLIVASTSGTVTIGTGYTEAVPAGVGYYTHQESRFPRWCDTDPHGTPRLPDELEQAVAYQVEYGIAYGSESYGLGDDAVVTGDDGAVSSRTYGSGYSESRVTGAGAGSRGGLAAWVAPKVRAILRELLNATGWL
jgi:hypothetical protein